MDNKGWKERLTELQHEVAQETQESVDKMDAWSQRLHQVFNSKSANRRFQPMTQKSKHEFDRTLSEASALVAEVLGKIQKEELTLAELNQIAADARDIMPANAKMRSLLRHLAFAAYEASGVVMQEEFKSIDKKRADISRRKTSIFHQYLADNPEVVPVLEVMIDKMGFVTAENVSQRLGRPVTEEQITSIMDDVTSIATYDVDVRAILLDYSTRKKQPDTPKGP